MTDLDNGTGDVGDNPRRSHEPVDEPMSTPTSSADLNENLDDYDEDPDSLNDDEWRRDSVQEAASVDRNPGQVAENARPLVEAESIHAGQADFAHQMWKYDSPHIESMFVGATDATVRKLTYEQLEPFTSRSLEPYDEIPAVIETELSDLFERLKTTRVALVVGRRGLGKGACALAVGARLMRSDQHIKELLITGPLAPDVRVRPEQLFAREVDFKSRIAVFEDAFDRGNTDLKRFAEQLDDARVQRLVELLRTAESYMIITSDLDHIPVKGDRLCGLGIVASMSPPPTELLVQALRRRSLVLESTVGEQETEALTKLLTEHDAHVAAKLGAVPKIIRFVDGHLPSVIAGSVTLDEALDQVDDLEHWLLRELPKQDGEAWSFVLALALASSDPDPGWVPWLGFHSLWQEVAEALKEALGGTPESCSRPASSLAVDLAFLNRTRASIRRLPFPNGQCVRFRNPDDAGKLWCVLLGSGRRLTALLCDRLRKLTVSTDPVVRHLAAQALGRAGEMDPGSLVFPRVMAWSRSRKGQYYEALGSLLTGALGSMDQRYRSGCLHRLRRVTEERSIDQVLSGILTWGQIGVVDLPMAMRELKKILEAKLKRLVSDEQLLGSQLRRHIDDLDRSWQTARQTKKGSQWDLMERLAPRPFSKREMAVFSTVQYALVGLCFARDPLQVLHALTGWMRFNKPGIAPIVALMVQRPCGILDIVERYPIMHEQEIELADAGRAPTCSRTLAVLEQDRDVLDLCDHFEALHTATELLPAWFRSRLREHLQTQLAAWGQQATNDAWLQPRVSRILSTLLDSSEQDLRQTIFHLLKEHPAFLNEQGKVGPVAAAAIAMKPLRRNPDCQSGVCT